jgi:hypothetical protein
LLSQIATSRLGLGALIEVALRLSRIAIKSSYNGARCPVSVDNASASCAPIGGGLRAVIHQRRYQAQESLVFGVQRSTAEKGANVDFGYLTT